MHMSDALISPAVGATMWAVSAGTIAYCSSKIGKDPDDRKIPLMGVLGAFLFAAQMINFSIPLTGSSGHLGGGLLLAILLGPCAAFLTISSVLIIQALFFADGGLLALGCNIFNLGFFPAFIAYPLVYKPLVNKKSGFSPMIPAAVISAIISLQLGAFAVVLETVASGISEIPFITFVSLMQPIHLAIGLVEGLVTAAVISFVYKARPDIFPMSLSPATASSYPVKNIALVFLVAALFIGGVLSWFASKDPDGLEWSIGKVTGKEELKGPEHGIYAHLSELQNKIALLPDYSFRIENETNIKPETVTSKLTAEEKNRLGKSASGLVGGTLTLALSILVGFVLRKRAVQTARIKS
jgi:cobalt/nickel transport system permease protein